MTNQTSQPTQADQTGDDYRLTASRAVTAERERELLELKGPCSTASCRLHYAHAGPCDTRTIPTDAERTKAAQDAGHHLDASTPTTQPCCTLAALTHHAKHATGCLGVALNAIDRRLSRLEDRVDEHLMDPEYDPADGDQDEPDTAERLATTAQAGRDVANELARTEAERDQARANLLRARKTTERVRDERDQVCRLLDQTRAALRVALHHLADRPSLADDTAHEQRENELAGCRIALQDATEAVEAAGLGSPAPRAQDQDVDDLLANARLSLTAATTDDERADVIATLLDGWYAAWPDEALTDPTAPLAAELVRLLGATWRPARPNDTPGELVPEHGPVQPVDLATRTRESACRRCWRLKNDDLDDQCTCYQPAAPSPYDHVLEVADGDRWGLNHPAGCATPAVCPVARLAYADQAAILALPVGRYQVGVGDLRDRLLIGDRVPQHDHTTGYPTFAPDAELCVNTSTGAEMWTGAQWNEHVTAAQKNRNSVPFRLITCPQPTCTTTCPAKEG